jgi:spore germination protein
MRQDSAGNGRDPARRGQTGPMGFLRPSGHDRLHLGHDRPQLTLADPESSAAPPPHGHARRRRRGLGSFAWLAVVPAAILAVALLVLANQTGPTAPPGSKPVVVVSLPYWSIGPGTETVLANRADISEVSPWIYGLRSNGQIILDSGVSKSAINAYLSRLRAQGLPLVPTLANVDAQGNWSYRTVAGVLHDPAMATRQVAEIVAQADSHHYAGIDLDYEDLHAGDRQAFTGFVIRLASALHAHGRILSVALFAKATNAGYAPRNVAQDYAAIGKVADQVRLMGYDYHWATSPPGPVAPIGWIRDVIRYAKTQIPASKIILGIPEYGYDWSGSLGTAITWPQALALSRRYHVPPRYDASSQSPWFGYTDASGRKHTVWFENAESAQAEFEVAHGTGIGGVYLWMYGSADPGIWSVLHQVLPLASRSSGTAQRGAS